MVDRDWKSGKRMLATIGEMVNKLLAEARKLATAPWKNENLCPHSSDTMAKLWSTITWKTENLPSKFVDLAKENLRQNVGSVVFFFNCTR